MAAARANLLEVLTPGRVRAARRAQRAHRGRLPRVRRRAWAAGRRARCRRQGLRDVRARTVIDYETFKAHPGRPSCCELAWLHNTNRGIFMTPGREEEWTLSVAHTEADVDALRRGVRRAGGRPHAMSAGASPFTAEHDELRDSIRRFVADELRPHASEWEDARWFPERRLRARGRARLPRPEVPEEYGGQGGDYLHDAVLAEELARCGSRRRRGRARRAHRDRDAADLEVRHRGPEAALPRPGDPRASGSRALGDHRARRRLRRGGLRTTRASASTAAGSLNGSKMFITNGVRADFIVTAVKTTAGGRPPRHLVPDRRHRPARRTARRRSRSSAGTRPTPR